MRWFHLIVVALFAAVTLVFMFQNFQVVSIAFLGFSIRMPLALLVAGIYLLGMVSGGSVLALLRRSIEGSRAAGPA
jgi:lipopolysaccharide assembly protein A